MDTILICFENAEIVKVQRFAQLGVAKVVANGWLSRSYDDGHFESETKGSEYLFAEDGNSRYVVII